ncbi:MAG: IS982 family transposase [Bifidobacteriaceae bacterium]|jgi:hypothetical protein|nr:IS982 family transposase [Bifidobacteriaceae bacterium]
MDTDLDSVATTLYVTIDDLFTAHREQLPDRPKSGFQPKTTDSEIVTLAVLQVVLGYHSERRWIRYVKRRLAYYFPCVPNQPGYNQRLRALASALVWVSSALARSIDQWADGVWVADSTLIECGRSKETVKRSDVAGWAQYGYCVPHSRYFWGLRLHLVATLGGLVAGWALSGAKAGEREVLDGISSRLGCRPGQTLITDKAYYGKTFEAGLAEEGIVLLRKARKGEKPRPGARFFNLNPALSDHIHAC